MKNFSDNCMNFYYFGLQILKIYWSIGINLQYFSIIKRFPKGSRTKLNDENMHTQKKEEEEDARNIN